MVPVWQGVTQVKGLSVELDHCKAVVQTGGNFQARLPYHSLLQGVLLSYLQGQFIHCILPA